LFIAQTPRRTLVIGIIARDLLLILLLLLLLLLLI